MLLLFAAVFLARISIYDLRFAICGGGGRSKLREKESTSRFELI